MIKSKNQRLNESMRKRNSSDLAESLSLIKTIVFSMSMIDESTKNGVVRKIEAELAKSQQKDALKTRETVLNYALELIRDSLFEEDSEKGNGDTVLFEELYIMGKLLERCYIHSTDIEYAQFYNKELALRCDNVVNERRSRSSIPHNLTDIKPKIDKIFLEIENKKQDYFSENHKEMSERTEHRKNKEMVLENYLVEVS